MYSYEIKYVRNAVQKMMEDSVMFTAYDITMGLRKNGMWIEHEESRPIIHTMYMDGEMGSYEQKSIILAGSNQQAILYVPQGEDVRNYHSKITGAKAAGISYASASAALASVTSPRYSGGQAVASTPAIPSMPSVQSVRALAPAVNRWSASQGAKAVDRKLRLRIPAQTLRDAGFKAGDHVSVDIDGDNERIIISRNALFDYHTIDMYGNLRIGLKKAGIGISSFQFSATPNTVVATPK